MFTGIIQDLGKIVEIHESQNGRLLSIHSNLKPENFTIGNSIAVNGVCLTVENYENSVFQASAIVETLNCTNLADLKENDIVNLEAPLTLQTPIAGHLVSGHVDACVKVDFADGILSFEAPENLRKYISKKGSITVNGVSLTIADVSSETVKIALIPETLKKTNLLQTEKVNLEVDMIARYLERLNS